MLYLSNSYFDLELDQQGAAGLRAPGDRGNTQFIRQGERFFGFALRYGAEGRLFSMDSEWAGGKAQVKNGDFGGWAELTYEDPAGNLEVVSRLTLNQDLQWELTIKNRGRTPVELLDVSTGLPTHPF